MIKKIDRLLKAGQIKEAAELIREALRGGVDFEGRHVDYAHVLLLSSYWQEITALLPKDTNFFLTSGWLNSIAKHRPLNRESRPIPWFTYPAIDFLDGILRDTWIVFEWGSGNSTLWWSSKVKKVIAIEDNESWYNEVRLQLPKNAEVFCKKNKQEYINAVYDFENITFDVVVVDGSHRNECAQNCLKKINQNGILIFDNSDGKDFEPTISYLSKCGFYRLDFWGLIPSFFYKNCTSVFFKNPEILNVPPTPSLHKSSVGISCFQALDRNKT